MLENYVHPYWGDKKLRSIRTKTVDDFYHFLLHEAEPASNMGKPKREHISPSTIHDIHKVMRCAFNQAKKWEYIAKNPFLDATLPEHKESKRDALTPRTATTGFGVYRPPGYLRLVSRTLCYAACFRLLYAWRRSRWCSMGTL